MYKLWHRTQASKGFGFSSVLKKIFFLLDKWQIVVMNGIVLESRNETAAGSVK